MICIVTLKNGNQGRILLKLQNTSTKYQTTLKFQYTMTKTYGLTFGFWLLDIVCFL